MSDLSSSTATTTTANATELLSHHEDWPAAKIDRVREAHPILSETLYLNSGTKGLTAAPVVEALCTLTRRVELGGYPGYQSVQVEASEARVRLAALLGADADEVAFTGNASYSLNAMLGLRWDRLGTSRDHQPIAALISDHEYPTTERLMRYLEQEGHIRRVRFRLSPDPNVVRESLDAAFDACKRPASAPPRLLVASHVCCNTGLRAPIQTITEWCRERGILSFIDGAQAIGQFPIDVHALGCDIYASNGHKWLFGPNGVGLLYVRRGVETTFTPGTVALGSIRYDRDYENRPIEWQPGAARFEITATRPAQIFATMGPALDWIEELGGIASIESRQASLTRRLKQRLSEMPDRFGLLSPPEWESSSALVSVTIPGRTGAEIEAFCARMLTSGRAWLRPVPEWDALRLSCTHYNTDEEYERLFAEMAHEGFN